MIKQIIKKSAIFDIKIQHNYFVGCLIVRVCDQDICFPYNLRFKSCGC